MAARGRRVGAVRRPRRPGRVPRRRGPVRRRRRGPDAGRVPGLPEGGRERGVRPGGRAGRREQQRQADDRARLQGPGVAGRGGARPVAGPSKDGTLAVGSGVPRPPGDHTRVDRRTRASCPYRLRGDAADLPGLAGLDKEELADVRRALPRARPDGGAPAGLRGRHPRPLPADRLRLPVGQRGQAAGARPSSWWRSATPAGRVGVLGPGGGRGRDRTRCSPSPPRPPGRSRRRACGTRPSSTAPAWWRPRWTGRCGVGEGVRDAAGAAGASEDAVRGRLPVPAA